MKALLPKRRITFDTEHDLNTFILECSRLTELQRNDTRRDFFKNAVYELVVDIVKDFEPISGNTLLIKVSNEKDWIVSWYISNEILLKAIIRFDFKNQKIIVRSAIDREMTKIYFFDEQSKQFKRKG